jgi:hypothetical protein
VPSEVTSDIDLYNHEIESAEGVLRALNAKVGYYHDAESYRQEIVGRFGDIGLVVKVDVLVPAEICKPCKGTGKLAGLGIRCLECNGSGGVAQGTPEFVGWRVSIVGRTDDHQMDWEQFGEEIRRDTLDIGEGGIVRAPE